MRIAQLFAALTVVELGCGTVDPRIGTAEQLVTRNEQTLAQADESYDLSERDITRLRAAVNDILERERVAGEQLEMAARTYDYATIHNHLAGDEFARAARNYEIAAVEYEKIASLIIRAASSKNVLHSLCGRTANTGRFDDFVNAQGASDGRNVGKPLNLPLPVLKALAERAARNLFCVGN